MGSPMGVMERDKADGGTIIKKEKQQQQRVYKDSKGKYCLIKT